MKVSIIIPNRNNVALLGITLRSLFEDINDLVFDYEVIIADNSDENIYEHIKDKLISTKFGYKFFRETEPCLFYSFDKAVKKAIGKYIIRLDSDMLTGKNMIKDMVEFMDNHKGIGFAHAPVNFFTQTPAASQHQVSLVPGNAMCRWAGHHKTEHKITYKGMPWICDREWYLNKLNGYGALTEHKLSPFGDPYIGIKSWLLGYESWAIPCRPGIHMGRMDSCKPFNTFGVNSRVGEYNSYMTACVTAYILTDDPVKWAPVFIRVGQSDGDVERATVNYYNVNKDLIEKIGHNDREWFLQNAKYNFEELIKLKPWENSVQVKNLYERSFPIWKSVAGNRSNSCIKQEDWKVLRGLVRKNKVKTVLEFGAGFSTILFDKLGLRVTSYETDQDYIDKIKPVLSKNIAVKFWDNKQDLELQRFDLALVDGIRPRTKQAQIAKEHSDVVVVHDIGASSKGVPEKILPDWTRIPNDTKRTGVYIKPNYLPNPVVSVIISHRNDFAMLGITVRSVLEDCIDLPGYVEVIICDNSTKEDRNNLSYVIGPNFIKSGQVRFLYQDFACLFTAREAAIHLANGKYILCLDSHMLIGRNMIRDMVNYMENDAPENIAFGHAPLVYVSQDDTSARHEFRTKRYFDKPHKMGVKGMPWIISKETWHKIKGYGSLAESKMSWGGGDVYLALKPWILGFENWAIPCRPGIHIGPYTKLDRKYYRYRLWGSSGETPAWYGLLAASYILGCDDPNNIVTQLRWYHCERFEKDRSHWNKINELCTDERKWVEENKVMSIEELMSKKPWEN